MARLRHAPWIPRLWRCYQRKEMFVKRCVKVSVVGAVMVVTWGCCYGWRWCDGIA